MALATSASNKGIRKHFDQSDADTALILTTPAVDRHKPQKLLWVSVSYSAVPVQTGIQIEIDSAEGAAFDALILDGTANDQFDFFVPNGPNLILSFDDAIRVTAPSGGGVITSTIVVQMQEIE